MKVTQIASILNAVNKEVFGETALVNEDLSNIVDVGNTVLDSNSVENYVKKLVDHIGKVVFTDRPYRGSAPSVLMDGWEYGSILEKITMKLPEVSENDSWKLVSGQKYDQDTFFGPDVSAKFYNSRTTFEIKMSYLYIQLKSAFSSAEQMNGFISMIESQIEKTLTVSFDNLIMRTINSMTAATMSYDDAVKGLDSANGVRAVNLLAKYNKEIFGITDTGDGSYEGGLSLDKCMTNLDFLKYASLQIGLYKDRMSKLSTIFNMGGYERFTPEDMLHVVMLSDFEKSVASYLQSDTFHNDFVSLPKHETVPFWQGSGTDYKFESTSKINVKANIWTDSDTVKPANMEISGIICVMFDRDALGVANLDRRVTTHNNEAAEFYTNFYKADAGYFNDFNENFVFFYVA